MTGVEFSRQQTVNQLTHGYGALPYSYGYPTGSFQPSWANSAWTMSSQNAQEQVGINQQSDNSSPDPSNSIANTSTGTNQSTPPPQVSNQSHENHEEVAYHQMNHFSIQGHVYQPAIQVNNLP